MKTIAEQLRDADPLRHEPDPTVDARDRLRRTFLAAASNVPAAPTRPHHLRRALVAAIAVVAIAVAAVGLRLWSQASTTLQAAVRFEVRLAEEQPAAGLQEARVSGSDRVIYLHPDIVVSNADIASSRVVQGVGPSRWSIVVEFSTSGAQTMRRATTAHLGKPIAILIDGDVVSAPVVRSPIGDSAVISGDYTREAAERIVNGMVGR